MNSRDRVRFALAHKEGDRVPFDLGGTAVTGIHVNAYRRLREYLGLPEVKVGIMQEVQQIADVDDDVREKLGVDVRTVAPCSSSRFRMEIRQDMPGYSYFYDEWGIGWRKPSDKGFFYDMFYHPLADAVGKEDIDRHPWPDPIDEARFKGMEERVKYVKELKKEAVVLEGLAAGFMEQTAWIRGWGKFYPDFVNNLEMLTYLMDRFIDLKLAYWDVALRNVGELVDVVLESDDLGGQLGMLISPDMYRRVCKPRHKRIFDFIKARTNAKIFLHSCGSIRDVIPDLIEIGLDILNPVQVGAAHMSSRELKKEFGSELTFWGGLVDTQGVFASGTPDQVRDEVRRRIEDLAPGGGFVAAAVHNVQANVPPENIVAMWETLHEYGTFS